MGQLKLEYEKKFLKQWNASGIDALVMPVMPWVNYPPKAWVKSKQWLGYSAPWNLLNYTSLVIPVTTADPSVDVKENGPYEPRNESDGFNHQQCKWPDIAKANVLILEIDDPELVKGMPVGVQIVTGRFGEEKAVSIAKLIESLQ